MVSLSLILTNNGKLATDMKILGESELIIWGSPSTHHVLFWVSNFKRDIDLMGWWSGWVRAGKTGGEEWLKC